MSRPISVHLVTAPGCQKCLQAKQALAVALEQARGEYQIELQEVDLTEDPGVAAEYDIWATPALIVDGELAAVGTISLEQLRQQLAAAAARRS
jgi:predicted DsbA family dithiol-disulfide isomerase